MIMPTINFKETGGLVAFQWLKKRWKIKYSTLVVSVPLKKSSEVATCTLIGVCTKPGRHGHYTKDLLILLYELAITTWWDQKLRLMREKKDKLSGTEKISKNNQGSKTTSQKQNVVHAFAVGVRIWREKKPNDCPVLKNQGTEARGMVYALGGGETNHDLDNTEDDINA
ncbi:hypothetical protein Tco_1371033 [Tanacetum coccineum]